tara:strand:+ start:192 stop:443 length:252 start_codon:yes stop_codon:yes gene_type:complete
MKVDAYTKIVLTVIALGIGFLVLDRNPVSEAQADSMGSSVSANTVLLQHKDFDRQVWHASGDKIRICNSSRGVIIDLDCTDWK